MDGRVFDEVVLDLVKPDTNVCFNRATFRNVVVSGIQPGPRDDGDSTEIVSFASESMTYEDNPEARPRVEPLAALREPPAHAFPDARAALDGAEPSA